MPSQSKTPSRWSYFPQHYCFMNKPTENNLDTNARLYSRPGGIDRVVTEYARNLSTNKRETYRVVPTAVVAVRVYTPQNTPPSPHPVPAEPPLGCDFPPNFNSIQILTWTQRSTPLSSAKCTPDSSTSKRKPRSITAVHTHRLSRQTTEPHWCSAGRVH